MFNILGGTKTIVRQGQKICEQDGLIKVKNGTIKELTSENKELYEENKDLRAENEELNSKLHQYEKIYKQIQKEILQTNNYNSVINVQNKLKSMLDTVSGKHFSNTLFKNK